jgi:hypothetical protein
MLQIMRNLTDAVDGYLLGKRYLIMDQDPLFTLAFRTMLAESPSEARRAAAASSCGRVGAGLHADRPCRARRAALEEVARSVSYRIRVTGQIRIGSDMLAP